MMYAIRIRGRGLVTTINDQPITTPKQAEQFAQTLRETLRENLGGLCDVELVVLHVKANTFAEGEA